MIKLHVQQGDCILEIVNKIPKGAKKLKIGKTFIVLKGEGANVHEIADTEGLEGYEENGITFLRTDRAKEILHCEHAKSEKRTILEPDKIYRRRIEREWDYEKEEMRNTRD